MTYSSTPISFEPTTANILSFQGLESLQNLSRHNQDLLEKIHEELLHTLDKTKRCSSELMKSIFGYLPRYETMYVDCPVNDQSNYNLRLLSVGKRFSENRFFKFLPKGTKNFDYDRDNLSDLEKKAAGVLKCTISENKNSFSCWFSGAKKAAFLKVEGDTATEILNDVSLSPHNRRITHDVHKPEDITFIPQLIREAQEARQELAKEAANRGMLYSGIGAVGALIFAAVSLKEAAKLWKDPQTGNKKLAISTGIASLACGIFACYVYPFNA